MAKKNKKADSALSLDVQLSRSEAFIEKNLKAILIVLGVVVVVAVGLFLWRNYAQSREAKAQAAIAVCQQAFAQGNYALALDGDSISQQGFNGIIREYGSTKTGSLARLYAALCYANLGQYEEAITQFEKFGGKGDQMVSPAAKGALANCYAEIGETEKAAGLFLKAAKEADNNAVSPWALIQAGILYESLGQTDKALDAYQQVKDKYYRSALSADIDKYIERVK